VMLKRLRLQGGGRRLGQSNVDVDLRHVGH
jgi:hypothetical protein